jgi:hypothetical protein
MRLTSASGMNTSVCGVFCELVSVRSSISTSMALSVALVVDFCGPGVRISCLGV